MSDFDGFIGIAGLGLIGGSLAKAIKANTAHRLFTYDISPQTQEKAAPLSDGALPENLERCDIVLVCLRPEDAVRFVKEQLPRFKKGAIIADICGVKRYLAQELDTLCADALLQFAPCHPMAGRELSGFDASLTHLFKGASMLVTPGKSLDEASLETLRGLFSQIGFGRTVVTTPENHDRMIAYTSQLAHVVSSAFIQSPAARRQSGYSAGSFRDLTRVAKLDPAMWTELFLLNRDYLEQELDVLIEKLLEFKAALGGNDAALLHTLLQNGTKLKEEIG